jgi:hypothetical protein
MTRNSTTTQKIGFVGNLCLAVLLALSLVSCSQGGGVGGTGVSASPTVVAEGPITAKGSIFVGGKEYELGQAILTVDGQRVAESALKIGMVVRVEATGTGTKRNATTVVSSDTLEGLVQSVAPDGLSLVVLNQTVLMTSGTVVDNSIPGSNVLNLTPGVSVVEVSGLVKSAGVIEATFIELKSVGPVDNEVKGVVTEHNAIAQTFKLGTLTVQYTLATISGMPVPVGNNWNGLFVEVKGSAFTPITGVLSATKVEQEGLGGVSRNEAEIEGFVTAFTSASSFVVGTVQVQTTAGTQFESGISADLALGAKVEAEGALLNGVLTATTIKFKDSARAEADIAALDAVGKSFTLTGLPGITVTTNSQTGFQGHNGLTQFTDLQVGDHVEVRGRPGTGNTVTAEEVKRTGVDDDVVLQGVVAAASNPTLTILGVSVLTSGLEFGGANGAVLTQTAFFQAITPNVTLVKVKGKFKNGAVEWKSAELEGESN